MLYITGRSLGLPGAVIVVLGILLCQAAPSTAQVWSSVLAPSRAIDWQANQPGVIGGIPTNRTQCGATIAAYTGSSATIINALASCPDNTYVQLGPGLFDLSMTVV